MAAVVGVGGALGSSPAAVSASGLCRTDVALVISRFGVPPAAPFFLLLSPLLIVYLSE